MSSVLDLPELCGCSPCAASKLLYSVPTKVVKERSRLHRILAGETWFSGEEFALAADDETLTTVLKRHMEMLGKRHMEMLGKRHTEMLGREALAPGGVLDHRRKRRILELMLARPLEQNRTGGSTS